MVAFPMFFCKVTLIMYVDIVFYMFCILQLETYPKCNTVYLPFYFCMQAFRLPIQVGWSSSKRLSDRAKKNQLQDSEAKVVSDALAKGAPQVGFYGFGRWKITWHSLRLKGFVGLWRC